MRFGVVLAIGLSLFVGTARAALFGARELTLANGLRVIVVENHKAPVVKSMLWYRVGSADEPKGKGGLAHLLEHLMFRGTKQVQNSDFNAVVAQNGASSNAFTSHDFTAYHEFTDVSRLETMLALEADRMSNLQISDEAFESERSIVAQERHQRVSNNPSAVFGEEADRLFWHGGAYGRPVSGTEDEIAALTIDDARSFYKRYYAPNRAVLVLAGDVTINDAKRLAKRWFADLTPAADGASAPIDDTVLPRTHYRLQREMPQIATPRVMIEHVAPSFSKDRKEAFALTLFAAYLGDGDNSYLNKNLVRTEKVLAAEAGYNGLRRGRGTFYAAAIPLAGTQADAAEDLLKQTLRNALKDFSARDLEKEKAKIAASLVYVNDNPEETAMMVGQFAALGFSLDEIESYADGLQQVGLGEVKEAVRRLLDDASSVTGVLLPLSSAGQEKK